MVSDFTGDAMSAVKTHWEIQTNTWESTPLARQNVAANVYQVWLILLFIRRRIADHMTQSDSALEMKTST